MTTDKIDTTPEAVYAWIRNSTLPTAELDIVRELSRKNAELRELIRCSRAREVIDELVQLRTQVAALQGAIHAIAEQVDDEASTVFDKFALRSICRAAIAYTGQPLAPTDPNHVEDA